MVHVFEKSIMNKTMTRSDYFHENKKVGILTGKSADFFVTV